MKKEYNSALLSLCRSYQAVSLNLYLTVKEIQSYISFTNIFGSVFETFNTCQHTCGLLCNLGKFKLDFGTVIYFLTLASRKENAKHKE